MKRKGNPGPARIMKKNNQASPKSDSAGQWTDIAQTHEIKPGTGQQKGKGKGASKEKTKEKVSDKRLSTSSIASKPTKLNSLLRSSDYSPYMQAGQPMEWRSSIHRYISLYNQSETEQHAGILTDYVADQDHCERLRCRLERLRERDLLRGALPAGSETKAELIRVNESNNEMSVLVRLHIKRRMEQKGSYYIEERAELERIWLSSSGGHWEVLRVEPIISERRPRYGGMNEGILTVDTDTALKTPAFPSVPYINYEVMQSFRQSRAGVPYRRDLAAAYADRWWNEGNPAYELFEVNCTHYVSQCIFAGNAPMDYTGKRENGWWYKGRNSGREWWSYSWAVSHALNSFLSSAKRTGLRAELVDSADKLQLGDVITYDWNGEGRFQHSTIVTAFDALGMPLVNANTVASRHRYWDYKDSYAWTDRTKYRFFHISDYL